MKVEFLTLDEVLALHHDQIARYGGAGGIRDLARLQWASGVPRATYGGELLHQTLPEMAAAYLFHIARNHPFVAGNKRTALVAALVFLHLNGHRLTVSEDELVETVVGVAEGSVSKPQLALFLEQHLRRRT